MKKLMCLAVALSAVALFPNAADAFCGFYVSGATGKLFNNATQVVMMRDGQRTVLSMQNDYQGPPQDFALVVPVPVVLQKEDVKTLPPSVFTRVDQMAAPRLVEYWEQDPCRRPSPRGGRGGGVRTKRSMAKPRMAAANKDKYVKIEAQFEVGEYEIVILSSNDSGALDAWLRAENYNIPSGAEAALRPYIEAGTKFFVARVNVEKVTFAKGRAVLSPLRFHYDSQDFSLPVRLGLLNANGPQDLIVHILARNQRYEVANRKNVTIPTNLIVGDAVRSSFGGFYNALFDKTIAQNPGAVVTEYSWAADTCDPCPGPRLGSSDFRLLGADVIEGQPSRGFVLTRLHARYTKETMTEDLVFRAAAPIVGGRGTPGKYGELREKGSQPGRVNNFQGRYAILHPWTGQVACQQPRFGGWGGPPGRRAYRGATASPAGFLSRPKKVQLARVLRQDVPELDLKAKRKLRLKHKAKRRK